MIDATAPQPFETRASIILLTYNSAEFLRGCMQALSAEVGPLDEILVIDNASTDNTAEIVRLLNEPRLRFIGNNSNLLSSRGLNRGIRAARGVFVVLLDVDTVVQKGWLENLLEPFGDPDVAVTGSLLLYPDGETIQHGGGRITSLGFTSHVDSGERFKLVDRQITDVDYVCGASIAIRRSVLEKLGGKLDELFPFYYEEVDLCWNVRRLGYKVMFAPASVAIHHESASMGRRSMRYYFNFHRGRCRFMLKNFPWRSLPATAIQEMRWFLMHGAEHGTWRAILPAYMSALASIPAAVVRRIRRRRMAHQ